MELAPAGNITVPSGFTSPPSTAPLDIMIWYVGVGVGVGVRDGEGCGS